MGGENGNTVDGLKMYYESGGSTSRERRKEKQFASMKSTANYLSSNTDQSPSNKMKTHNPRMASANSTDRKTSQFAPLISARSA